MDSIVYYNANQSKCESYGTDLNDGNFRNDLDAIIVGTGIERDYINSGYVYNDINNQRQNSTLWLLSAVVNIKSTVFITD